jgi:flagellar biosynthesis chaperone FliJ
MKLVMLPLGCLSLALAVAQIPGSSASRPSNAPPPANDGVTSEWDARKLIDALSAQAQHLKPIVDQVQPTDWVSKGASETYIAQWKQTQAQLKYLLVSSDAFARDPERLPLGLDMYFRMESVDSTLRSLEEGVQKYQNPALATMMQSVIAENGTNRGRLRQYLQDLAKQKEEEFQVADGEAQRCRAALLKQSGPATKKVSR